MSTGNSIIQKGNTRGSSSRDPHRVAEIVAEAEALVGVVRTVAGMAVDTVVDTAVGTVVEGTLVDMEDLHTAALRKVARILEEELTGNSFCLCKATE